MCQDMFADDMLQQFARYTSDGQWSVVAGIVSLTFRVYWSNKLPSLMAWLLYSMGFNEAPEGLAVSSKPAFDLLMYSTRVFMQSLENCFRYTPTAPSYQGLC